MLININESVKVKLTPLGRKIHRDRHEAIFKDATGDYAYVSPVEDENGWSKWQLWHLFNVFGEHLRMGLDHPFDITIEILVPAAPTDTKG